MNTEAQPALQFMTLFAGRDDAIGLGVGRVERRQINLSDYVAHLNGEGSGIGIFPLRDDGTVSFAAIDLDEPDFELARTMQKLLPGTTWIERSRSGNAHVWAFFKRPAPGWVARGILRNAIEAVGRDDIEVFPKQDRVREGGVGNYINLPLHGTDRPLLSEAGNVMDRLEFIDAALHERIEPDTWQRRAEALGIVAPELREVTSEWGTAPYLHECATYIIENCEESPLKPGHRHQVLFHLACQLLNWQESSVEWAREQVDRVNDAAIKPLSEAEIDRLFENALRGRFTFTGCDDPVMAPYVSPECPIA